MSHYRDKEFRWGVRVPHHPLNAGRLQRHQQKPLLQSVWMEKRMGWGVSAEKPLHREELTFQKRKHFLMTWAKDRMSTTNSFLKQQISSYQKSLRRGASLPPFGILQSSSTRHQDHPASWRVTGLTGDLAAPQKAWRDLSLISPPLSQRSAPVLQAGDFFIILTFGLEMDAALPCHHHHFCLAQSPSAPCNGDALKKGHCGDRFVETKGQV